jgi:hypothetical protein
MARAEPVRISRPKLPPSERDNFILQVAERADGHVAPVIDLVYALATRHRPRASRPTRPEVVLRSQHRTPTGSETRPRGDRQDMTHDDH